MPVLLLFPLALALSTGNAASAACCYPQHTELIKRRLGSLEDNACQTVSEEVLCVMCEPRFGTGEYESKGKAVLCPELCEKWFNACKDEFVSASPSGSSSALTFCEDSSLICSRLSATLGDSVSFCRQMGYEVPEDDGGVSLGSFGQSRRSCFNGVPTASFGAAPKRSDGSEGYRRRRETQNDWQEWFRGIGLAVYEVLCRPEVWLLLLVLGFLLNQLVQQARDIMLTQIQEEKLQRRQQILQRYGVEEEEEEIETVPAADEKDSATLRDRREEKTGGSESSRCSSPYRRTAMEGS